ncbi:hypothetical protein ACLBOM_08000 [Escherichia coli]
MATPARKYGQHLCAHNQHVYEEKNLMNTNHQQLPSGIESEAKYTLQFWLLSNGKVMTEKDGLCTPFPELH